jgi:hypothetical protein
MIVRDEDLIVVSRQLEELKKQRDCLLGEAKENAFQVHVEVAGLEKMIARLQEEIADYENRQRGLATVQDGAVVGRAERPPSPSG